MRRATGLAALLLIAAPLAANDVRFFRLNSRRAFLAGTLEGIGVDSLGTMSLADRADRVGEVGEPFLFAAARHPDGWVLGTGNGGRVLLLERSGQMRTLFEAPEPEIFAVWAADDGTVYAGSSPDGQVYRIPAGGGEAEPFYDPGETYIWALAGAADGSLLVATGTEGRLHLVDEDGGRVLYDSEDTHLRALSVLDDGSVLVGTAGEGLILRVDRNGEARTLYDARHPEVVAFARAPDGARYAAVLASEGSLVDLAPRPTNGSKRDGEADEGEDEEEDAEEPSEQARPRVATNGGEDAAAGSRPAGFKGPRSEILRLSAAGDVETVWRFEDETVYSLLWHRGRLWAGTGLEGQLFSLRDRRMVLEKDVDERQVVALLADTPGPAFATTNAAAFYRISGGTERSGTYTSATLDAGGTSLFGTLAWQGDLPSGTSLRFSYRTGMSSEPDRTWAPWSSPAGGPEISLADAAPGRYLQWRAHFEASDGRSPKLRQALVSYRQRNLAPRIEDFEVLGPGEVEVPTNFNPGGNYFDPAHPDRQGIFTPLESTDRSSSRRRKNLWKKGFRTLTWEADDPNGDALVYSLEFALEGAELDWLPMAERLEDDAYSFDATVLPDGVYRFRLKAVDRQADADEPALEDDRISEPVLIDHTPPRVARVERRGDRLEVEVRDALNPLRDAAVSADAGRWLAARTGDGLLDGLEEVLLIDPPADGRLLLLRLTDAAFNVVTVDLSEKLR